MDPTLADSQKNAIRSTMPVPSFGTNIAAGNRRAEWRVTQEALEIFIKGENGRQGGAP